MKTYKEKTTDAIREFIDVKYIIPVENLDLGPDHCILCKIFRKDDDLFCCGCINIVFHKWVLYAGCLHSKTFRNLIINKTTKSRDMRRKFWQIVLPKLKDIPNKYFTRSGFAKKPFKFMLKIDKTLYNEM